MNEDPRCCGSGTCIIETDGRCWCGQQWDGLKICRAPLVSAPIAELAAAPTPTRPPTDPAHDRQELVSPARQSKGT